MLSFASCHSEESGTGYHDGFTRRQRSASITKKSPGSGYGTARDLARTSDRKLPSPGQPLHRRKSVSRRAVRPCRGCPERGVTTSQPPGIRGMSDYTRSVRSDVSGHASVGYVNSVNAPTVAPAVSATAQIGLDYVLGRTLTGSILDTFSYQNNGAVLASGRAGDVTVNQFQFLLSKTS